MLPSRILLWILCIILACYHHLNTELENGPDSFVALVTVVAFPISMFVFDSLMLVTNAKFSEDFKLPI